MRQTQRNLIIEYLQFEQNYAGVDLVLSEHRLEPDLVRERFEAELAELVEGCGQVLAGPCCLSANAVYAEYLAVLERDANVETLKGEFIGVRLAEAEIFTGSGEIFHVSQDSILRLRGEVVCDIYETLHGSTIFDLEVDFHERIQFWAEQRIRRFCHPRPQEAISSFMEQLACFRPADLKWREVDNVLNVCFTGGRTAPVSPR
jgi:hypothetical protein